MRALIAQYFSTLDRLGRTAAASDAHGEAMPLEAAFARLNGGLRRVREEDAKVIFIGNGGSAGIASHLAIDFTKNGRIPALAFNDGAALTCLGNDLGYEEVFAAQIAAHARKGDLLIAISSSGRSPNILKAIGAARQRGCEVATLSGFGADNPLRRMGDINLYVASDQYGFVEVVHLGLLHAVLDLACGWQGRVHGENPPDAPLPAAPASSNW